ncbi:hypothetical protein DUI87_16514 [Hirundo rustica rustica]|uniref:Integrase-type domain-containing protein n=1 Tax=Hirundo rustica rustica TaxID=333673 RepID=A0A3M0K7N5_HIRRU|nr:hypothetical protein DUI87_16514 [Hirundo rustica rustica]
MEFMEMLLVEVVFSLVQSPCFYEKSSGLIKKSRIWRPNMRLEATKGSQKAGRTTQRARGQGISHSSAFQQKLPDMIVKDPATREAKSPHDQVTWGCGYAYVSTPPDLKWVPAEWVKPFIPKTAKPPAEAHKWPVLPGGGESAEPFLLIIIIP